MEQVIYLIKNLFLRIYSQILDNKEGEDVSWSLKVRKNCITKSTDNLILEVQRYSKENEAISDIVFHENNKRLNLYL